MLSQEAVSLLVGARQHLTTESWHRLTEQISLSDTCPNPQSVTSTLKGLNNNDAAWLLSKAFSMSASVKWCQIGAAMFTIDHIVGSKPPTVEIIWTGPPNGRFPVRRVDQVLYDLIANAQNRILLVTFAAHRIAHLCQHLTAAVTRGVKLTLIVESENESKGQLSVDALKAFRSLPLDQTVILYWPNEKRNRNDFGRPGKLHAKCAVVDNIGIVGSANLTDDAFNRNMELGLLLRDEGLVEELVSHFSELHQSGVLKAIDLRTL